MDLNADTPAPQRLAYAGFAREAATYERLKADLLREAEGKFIAIVGDEMVGGVETFGEVLGAGYRRFGAGPLYVKQIQSREPVAVISRDIKPCRP